MTTHPKMDYVAFCWRARFKSSLRFLPKPRHKMMNTVVLHQGIGQSCCFKFRYLVDCHNKLQSTGISPWRGERGCRLGEFAPLDGALMRCSFARLIAYDISCLAASRSKMWVPQDQGHGKHVEIRRLYLHMNGFVQTSISFPDSFGLSWLPFFSMMVSS